ncbi:MAG TPA: amino acid adenylation domain-containing protein, partial [Anaerolineae bacterium]|nr:amino acid adenylation domain-containing protein [Anaerolineae bacterium]
MTSGIELSPKRRALLAELLKKQGIDVASTRIPRRAGDRARAPLSFAQERLWFLDRLEPGRATYNLPLALRLRGPLEVKALEQALAALVSRHEALRTTFADVDGRPEQVIGPPAAVPLPIVDLRALPEAEREDVLLRRAYEEVQRPFDLRRGPLFRSLLLWLDDEYYAVVLTLHHIVMDAWSMEVLARDIVALYQAAVSGAPAPLPELTIQYADYAVWQREWLHGKVLQEQLAYWKRQLAGIVPVLSLPTDRPRPPVLTYRGADFAFTLPNDLVDALRDLGQAEGASLFMTLLAAFNVLLYRYTGQEDILVGSPITNRQRAEVKDVMGFFLNTIALRTDLTGSPSFRELLRQVRATVGEAFAHQDLPFEKLVEELQPKRDMSHAPLVNVMFVLNTNTFAEPPRLAELTVEPLIIENQTANFDLTLSLIDVAGWEVSGTFGYNTDLFDAATIARMAGHFRTLLESLVIKPDQPLWDLLLLTETERRQLLVEWNDTQTNYPQAECIHALFEAQARRTPEAVAVVFEDRWLSYGELNSRANQLARCLQKLGVGPEVLVGICMERSLDMVIGLLGILKAGGAYLPLDPNYPKERLAFMLADSRVAVLLTQAQLAARLPQSEAAVVCLDTEWDAIAGESVEDLASYPTLDNLAYVIYTSGSTGRPKGVLVPHAGLLNLVFWHIESYRVKPTDRATQVASIGFDASVWELWPYLAAGASIHLIDDEETRIMPARLRDWLISRQITLSFLPTPLAEAVLSLEWPESYDLQVLLTGGDRLSSFAPAALKFKLVNHYGPTESSVVTTAGRVPPEDSQVGLPAIGKPIANTQVYLLDARLQPVPIGVPGELCIGSIGLARGYLNHPDLTAEKFIPNPFWKDEGGGRNASREAETPSSSPAPEAHPLPAAGAGRRGLIPQPASFRLYRTGDLCRYRPDGNIEFLGRIDHQVKVRGYRIEPGEIEAVLGQHPAIKDVVVVAQETPPDRRLVAYVVPRSAQPPTIAEMRECIQQRLPDYMIPAAFVTLEALPLTPSGKVDRRALRLLGAPEEARPELAGAYVAPRSPVETTLSNIWSQLLKVKQVGVHDNFFELGGDSILSIQVIARANQAGLHLTPKQLFQHQTIAELAAVVNTAPENQAEQGLVTGPVPLTPIQHWFFEQALPEPHQWNQALLLEVRGPVDAERLEQAVRQLLIHHDALRLRFEHNDTGWQQVNAAGEGASPFSRVDLSGRAEAEQKAILEATVSRLQTELDLKDGPLLRVAYFDLGTERPGRLFIAIHHLVVDGVSWRILLEDLQTAYRQLGQAQPISLPPKTTSFQEWTRRLEAYAQRVELRTELDYWLEQPWAAVAPLPTDIPHASRVEANRVASERSVLVELSEDETRALLQTVPEAYHSQINDVLLAALGLTLARWTGKQMFSVDLEGHGREDLFDGLDLSRTVGWFTSLFPVLLAVESNSEVGKTLKTVKEHLRGIPQHGLGYGLLRYLCQDREVADRLQTLPQAEVSFNYLGQLDQTLAGESMFAPARESTGPAHSPLGKRNHVLELNGAVIEGRLQMAWGYSEDLHRRATIEQLAEWFGEALRGLITHCLAPEAGGYTPSDFPIMKFNQLELDELFPVLGKGVEDIYPLTPMQEGMLFHCLVAPESGMYFERLSCTVRGELNPAAFEQAWQQAIARHTILRTAFQWEHRAEPFQVVYRQVRFPIEWHDWRELSAAEQAERLAAYLEADQKLGFDLARPPLLRLAFMRLSENTYQLVWSHHHLLLDGWSMPMLLKEVFGFYAAFCQGRSLRLEAPRPYRDYIAWLQQQDQTAAEAFWRKALHGFTAPTALTIDRTARSAVLEGEGEYAGQGLRLSAETTAALQRFSRQQQVTLNTMVQGAWALLLSRYSGEEDVVFGVTVSGRPAELAGIENILGMFINTLPLRVRTPPEGRLLTWLKALQAQQVELRQYEYSPLVKVQGWSDVARGRPLFESLVVFENYPVDSTQREGGQGLELSNVQIVE